MATVVQVELMVLEALLLEQMEVAVGHLRHQLQHQAPQTVVVVVVVAQTQRIHQVVMVVAALSSSPIPMCLPQQQ